MTPLSHTFNPCHFNGHELHDVLQLTGDELSRRLCHSGAARASRNRDAERDGEHDMLYRLLFDPACMSYELRAAIAFAMSERNI